MNQKNKLEKVKNSIKTSKNWKFQENYFKKIKNNKFESNWKGMLKKLKIFEKNTNFTKNS